MGVGVRPRPHLHLRFACTHSAPGGTDRLRAPGLGQYMTSGDRIRQRSRPSHQYFEMKCHATKMTPAQKASPTSTPRMPTVVQPRGGLWVLVMRPFLMAVGPFIVGRRGSG